MSEYVDITKDYIHRCLENYIKFNEETQFNVTLAITTLQAVSMAFVSQCDSKPYSETSFLKEISSEISTLFENNQSFKTGRCNYQHWNNIRNAFSHMMEKNVEIFPNKEKEIEKISKPRLLFLKHFPGGSGGKESACNAGDPASIPGL